MREGKQQDIINTAFQQLDGSIKGGNYADEPLPEHVTAGDFMLMGLEPQDGYWRFKNATTRNYILVEVYDGTIHIPKTNMPFARGEF